MTKNVFKTDETDSNGLLEEFFSLNEYLTLQDKSRIRDAWNLLLEKTKGILRSCGKPYYVHPLRVAQILANSKLDADTLISAILHTITSYGVTFEDLEKRFGTDVCTIIKGTDKILNIPINTKTLHQSDAIRKMLFAMVDDVRIILLTLADRLDRIRNIKNMEKEQQRILAEGILEIWAPLADRLGMQAEKNEFEDLSLKYANPAVFKQIKEIVSQKQDERKAYLEKAVNSIYKKASASNIDVTITSRAKHFYSIYQKMRKRNKEPGELYDLLALRILCKTPAECYTLLGIVHSLWKPLDGRFKDYIAMPKANGYQSLHTTVMCEDKPLEIQIRTYEMHNMAEHGIASHWLYKKGTNRDLVEADKLDIFNQLQKLKESHLTDEDFFATLKNDLLGDEIYVFTPKGDVIKLPAGSTAIDFAYSIHSAIGEKIVAAKADGKIIPLSQPLKNTQIIEVITNPQSHPTENQLKLVKTTKAHQKIHVWLANNDPNFCEKVNNQISQKNSDSQTSVQKSQPKLSQKNKIKKNGTGAVILQKNHSVIIDGSSNVVYNLAKCCHPVFPDIIEGYISQKGITIHRADCLVYQRIPNKEKRTIKAEWNTDQN